MHVRANSTGNQSTARPRSANTSFAVLRLVHREVPFLAHSVSIPVATSGCPQLPVHG